MTIDVGDRYPIALDRLPGHWRTGYVGDFALTIEPGFASGKHNSDGDGVPHLRPMNVDRNGRIDLDVTKFVAPDSDVRRLRAGDVLFNNTNSPELVGKTAAVMIDGPYAFSNHMTRLRFRDDVDSKYAAHQLHFLWMKGYFKYRCVKHVNQASISSRTLATTVPFVAASAPEQQLIVAEIEKQFSRLDQAVANLQRVESRLSLYRDAVLLYFFGGQPNATMADLIESGPQNGLYLPKSQYGTGVPILRIDDYQTDWIRPVGDLRRVAAAESQVTSWSLTAGDLVVNRVNSISHLGKCVSVPEAMSGVLFESNMMRLHLKPGVLPRYVELYLGSKLGKARLTANAKWAVNQASINQQDVLAATLPLPDFGRQRSVVAEVDRRLSIVRGVEAAVDANLKRAQALRQAVLARAFAG